MKQIKMLVFFLSLFILLPSVYAQEYMPEVIDNKITLTEDVILTEKYLIDAESEITIDLNGHTLTGPSDNYALDNYGTLNIIDSASEKGKIICTAPSSSCIDNLGTLNITGITVEGPFVIVKNDYSGVATITSSTLTSSYAAANTGTIMNWGKAKVSDSKITASSSGAAIYATSGWDTALDSEIDINNCELEGKYFLYSKRYSTSDTTFQTINIEGGYLNGSYSINGSSSEVTMSGEIKTVANSFKAALTYGIPGTNVILTENITNKDATIPEGITLTIAEGITYNISSNRALVVNGELNVLGSLTNAFVYNKTTKTYYPTLTRALNFLSSSTEDLVNEIVILNDLTETTASTKTSKIATIDLNGYTYTGNITNAKNSTINIIDSSKEKTGTVTGTITNNGTLNVFDGNYNGEFITSDTGTTTLEGGIYPKSTIANATIPAEKELKENEDGTYSLVYKSADYTKVTELLNQANMVDKSLYTDVTIANLMATINSVVEGKNITEQNLVDEMAQNLENALRALRLKSEDIPVPSTIDNIEFININIIIGILGISSILKFKRKMAE